MAIDFALSEVVALAVESFCCGAFSFMSFEGGPWLTSAPLTGIYFALFGSSVKVLYNKRKTISSALPLLGLASVFAILITWVQTLPCLQFIFWASWADRCR
jgi:hypothetical protein